MNGPVAEVSTWLLRWPQLLVAGLMVVCLVSGIGVVYSVHTTRMLYSEIQSLQTEQDRLDSDYEKLLLEQSAWAAYTRVDELSRDELNMVSPDTDAIVMVQK
ncbi:MAG: cell division protein FtsL [Gammaproteobacteria bacterium]|uniref:Cell division protein FtsL n=1 Tax=OM182 bacterium MED-G24 TaxID=1986255 RepID=A0A2A5WS36_9GAMM|nr:cell division protein FtsL [Gammaproteobacteria bacterium]PDH39047.1 MAG: cell division protein FtsL [OM182 bacterium MED-G24]RPG27609.1 MAG: cell division protein FtsL [Gammaproteobacteria bacterium TMED50]